MTATFGDLPYEARVLVWLLLPLLAALMARRLRVPKSAAMALGTAVAITLYAFWITPPADGVTLTQVVPGSTHDIFYLVSMGRYLFSVALTYLTLAALIGLAHYLSSSRRQILPNLAFWLFHLGAPLRFFPQEAFVPLMAMPRHYIEYPEVIATWNRTMLLGSLAIWAMLVLLCGSIAVSLVSRLWARSARNRVD
jgi:hypothetical protein